MEAPKPKLARADHWVSARYPSLSRAQVQEAFTENWVRNGTRPLKKGDRVAEEDCDTSKLSQRLQEIAAGNSQLKIPVVFESQDFWVIDKPAGVPSHPLHLIETSSVTHWALARDSQILARFGKPLPTLAVHRLDTGTSGLLIVARTPESYQTWRERFQTKLISKCYRAWCWGVALKPNWEIDYPIAHHAEDRTRMVAIKNGDEKVRPPQMEARTSVRVLLQREDRFLAEIETHSGVTHQVRVHLAAMGFPLIGDKTYDPQFSKREEKPNWHALRAIKLKVANGPEFSVSNNEYSA